MHAFYSALNFFYRKLKNVTAREISNVQYNVKVIAAKTVYADI